MEHSDSHSLSEQVWRIAVESSDDARCFPRFRLIEQIGCGGSGAVWKAYDPELNRLVAVKIPRRILTTVSETEAFLREGRAAGKLNHRGIVTIHEVGLHDGVPFLVSSLIEGLSLREWYLRTNPGHSRIVRICLLIAEALEYAHSSGVIHRDLKPDNIIIDAEDQPHILDFGLAKRELNDVTISIAGGVIGTPFYMSPEQAMGEGHFVDRKTDIYSLGVILFEMLTGQLPFFGDARMLLTKIICDDPPLPRTINAAPVVLDANASVLDQDSGNFAGGRLTVAISANAQSSDRIGIRHTGTAAGQIGVSGTTVSYGGVAIGTFSGTTTLSVMLNDNAAPLAVQALLRSITFSSLSENPSTLDRTVKVTLTDGDGGTSNAVAKTVSVSSGVLMRASRPDTASEFSALDFAFSGNLIEADLLVP